MRYFFLVVFSWFAAIGTGGAQTVNILVKDSKKEPLTGATVQLMRVADSTSFYEVTGAAGRAVFQRLSPELYLVKISFLGYAPLEKTIRVKAGDTQFEFVLEEASLDLDEVTVRARRPLIRQEDDKTIIDPEPLANISTNTLEVLENTPGLFVDQDGNIYLTSATPAAVYINGREQRMSAQDIATILRSLPPGSIQRIEVLRTPSTKYDAASSGGIVNVVLKKGVKIGRTGSVNLGMNQGAYGNRFAGFNINDSNERSTFYLNANYNHRDLVEDLNSIRFLSADSVLRQSARTRLPADQGNLGFGLNHDASEKWNLSYDGRANLSFSKTVARNLNLIEAADNQRLSENDNRIENNGYFLSIQQDLGANYKMDTLGSEWDTKFSYVFSRNTLEQDYLSSFITPFDFNIRGEGENLQQRHFFLFQSDLTYLFPGKIKLETGIKSTYQNYSSKADYFIGSNGSLVVDALRTNAFDYQENINAAYLQAAKTLPGNLLLKAGLRLEHTYMQGNQTIPADTSFVINRADLFPYLYLSRRVIEIAGYELRSFLIYRKTINRPGYQSLNPAIKYIDQFLYEIGNPGLQPQFTDNFEANISFDDMPIFAVGRNFTSDIFSNVIYQDPEFESVAVRTFDNVGKNKETYFRGVAAIPPGGKYFFVAGAQYNLNEYEGLYEGQPLSFTRGSWRFFTFHSLSLTKQTKLTMSGFMMLRGQQNFYELDTFGQLNFGLSQTFLDKKLNISLNARDVLRTMVTQFTLEQGNIITQGDRYSDNKRFGLNARYSFGIRKKEPRGGLMPLGEMGE
jgi:iron complex outermembrane recepter protein